MASALQALRQEAKKLGVDAKAIRQSDRAGLEKLIAEAKGSSKPSKKGAAKKAVKKAAAKAKAKTTAKSAKKSAPAKSTTAKRGTAKRRATQKPKATVSNSKGGRNTLDGIDWSDTESGEGWNPRPGSAPDRIHKLLKKFKGNRQKVYEALLPDIGDFVKNKRRDGSAWEKGEGVGSRKAMLKYRISRTAWQFATQTGQHESSSNRVEYGTGGTGAGIFKRNKHGRFSASKATARKATAKKATARKATGRKSTQRKATRKTAKRR